MSLGNKIKELRKKWQPTFRIIAHIANALSVSMDELLSYTSERGTGALGSSKK